VRIDATQFVWPTDDNATGHPIALVATATGRVLAADFFIPGAGPVLVDFERTALLLECAGIHPADLRRISSPNPLGNKVSGQLT
jgi:hypothetical protein